MSERASTPPPASGSETDLALEAALRAAWSPGEIDASAHESLLAAVLNEPLAPPTRAELAEAEALRAALEPGVAHADLGIGGVLRAAWSPRDLEAWRHERLLAALVSEPLSPPTGAELAEAEALRAALERAGAHPEADLARAMRAAAHPLPLSPERNEALIDAALRPRARVAHLHLVSGLGVGLALAAGVALLLRGPAAAEPPATAREAVAFSRSAAPLFERPFEHGGASARMDRIARARARDLRENRFTSWGLR